MIHNKNTETLMVGAYYTIKKMIQNKSRATNNLHDFTIPDVKSFEKTKEEYLSKEKKSPKSKPKEIATVKPKNTPTRSSSRIKSGPSNHQEDQMKIEIGKKENDETPVNTWNLSRKLDMTDEIIGIIQ
jgi:hypothetical protein